MTSTRPLFGGEARPGLGALAFPSQMPKDGTLPQEQHKGGTKSFLPRPQGLAGTAHGAGWAMSVVTFQEQRGETLPQPVTWRSAGTADICGNPGDSALSYKGFLEPSAG